MSKLHELLAVEGELDSAYRIIIGETEHTFKAKHQLFFGYEKRLENFVEGSAEAPKEFQELTTTVIDKLYYFNSHCIKYFDAVLQKETTNQLAKADIMINGWLLAKDVPVTFLLGLENKLKAVREVYKNMPTLPNGISWLPDNMKGLNVWRMEHPEEKFKTAKTFKHKVLYEATDKHPAQIERWEENENVGKYITEKWSGLITSAKKAEILERFDNLIRAVKKARQRGNNCEVIKNKISQNIFDYILDGGNIEG